MSKVSHKNDALPTFEPIQQTKVAQKRKRSTVLASNENEETINNKRAKAKKDIMMNEPIKSSVWIGAATSLKEKNIAAYSIFFGLNDKRNLTERVTLDENQDLIHVYILGAVRALEKCENNSLLSIYIGNEDIQTAINQESQDVIYSQIKEKLAQRKGATLIRFKEASSTGKNEEYNLAYKMAVDELKEEESEETVLIDESVIVESLEVTTVKEDVEMIEKSEEIIIKNTTIATEETIEETVTAPSWTTSLNLRNLLDILKAPFTRNNKKN